MTCFLLLICPAPCPKIHAEWRPAHSCPPLHNFLDPLSDNFKLYAISLMLQTHSFVLEQQKQWSSFKVCRMGIWEAMELLNELVDDSDPDTALPQIQHLFQTAEACRKAYPEVMRTRSTPLRPHPKAEPSLLRQPVASRRPF